MNRIVSALAVTMVLGGCVSTRTTTLSGEANHSLQGKSLVVTTRAKPDFSAMTPGKAMFGLIGAAAMISSGNSIVAENGIVDPAGSIGEQLREVIAGKLGLVAVASAGPLADSTDTARLSALYSSADIVLDVQTVNWSFVYRPNIGTQHYRVIYSVKVRLIDTHQKSLLSEAFCVRNDDNDANPPTHDELLANQAQILKVRLAAHGQECVGELKQKVLGTAFR